MSKLSALIAEFVTQVTNAVCQATLADLQDVIGAPIPRGRVRPAAAEPRQASRQRSRAAQLPLQYDSHEITSPEALLDAEAPSDSSGGGARPQVAPPVRRFPERKRRSAARESSSLSLSPPPAEAPAAPVAPPALRDGETLVRASNAGVVIRRAKRE